MSRKLRVVHQDNWYYIAPENENCCIQWFTSLEKAENAKLVLEKTVDCCELGNKYISHRIEAESYGPKKDGPSMLVDFDSLGSYGIYGNVDFCPFCGNRLDADLTV